MAGGLFDLWGLASAAQTPPDEGTSTDASAVFRDAIAEVNANLQSAMTAAPQQQHAALDADRSKLYEAYQLAAARGGADPQAGEQAMQRVVEAASALSSKAAGAASAGAAAKQQWSDREAEFDDAALKIHELVDAGHPSGKALQNIAEFIRQRVGQQQFDACITALDALAPKLESLIPQQNAADSSTDAGDPATSQATLEVRVSYQGTPVPGATVRLSTGPTKLPDAATDTSGVAVFRGVEPGEYHVNAAKRAFVFQPAHVAPGRLAPGAVCSVNISKAAQGQPPAPGYLYSGGGPAMPMTPPGPGQPTPPTTPGGTTPGGTPPTPGGPPPVHPTEPPQPTVPGEVPPGAVATVEVHVHDEKGAPVDKAMVRISTGPTSPPDGQTNSAGIVRFQLVPGEYHVNAAKRDVVWQPAHIAAGALQPSATYPVTLSKPHYPKPDGDTSSLSVHVTWGRGGKGVQHARVDVDGNPKYSAPTDASGFARFENLPVGPHSIQATHVSEEYGTVSRSATAYVTKDKQVTKTISLSRYANLFDISVLITWKPEEGKPAGMDFVEGAIVTIDAANVQPAVTNSLGQASFHGLPAGTYSVTALIPPTAQTITASKVIASEDADVRFLTVPMQADRDADPANPNANTTGELIVAVKRDGTDLDAVGAVVSLSPAAVPSQTVPPAGDARFRNVPAGEYVVTAVLTQEDGTTSMGSAHATVDANVRTETGLLLQTSIKGGELYVTVSDNAGNRLDGILVSLNDFAGSEFTNTSGIATFSNIPPGSYVVTAHPDIGKYDAEPVTASTSIEAGQSVSLPMTMSAKDAPVQTGKIYVSVSTPGGKDLDFTYVAIYPEVHPPQMAGTGHVTFSNIPVGEYMVEAVLDDMVARQQVILESSGDYGGSASANLVLS